LLGSHVSEQLVERGYTVRALVREASETSFLKALGVSLVPGDLTNVEACQRAVDGVDFVFHSAAKVGDWGRWPEFQIGCIDATRNLARAALQAGVRRFVHFSSTSAYGHPPDQETPIAEDAPLGQNVWVWDPYTRSKVECEQILWSLAESERLPLTIIRPSWLFGERDRTTVPRLIREFRRGRVRVLGRGDNPLSAIYAGEVASAAIRAAVDPGSVGEAYNITSHGRITQRDFLDLFADSLGARRVRWHFPYWFGFYGGFLLELQGRLLGWKTPPRVTRYGAWLLGRRLEYSTTKARERLGWSPSFSYAESLSKTLRWFLEEERTTFDQPRGTSQKLAQSRTS
jgi:nucleoside-diphosphate-sugar epimerase